MGFALITAQSKVLRLQGNTCLLTQPGKYLFCLRMVSNNFCLSQCLLDSYQLHTSDFKRVLLSADEVFCFMKGFDGVLMPLMIYSTVIVAMYWGFPQIKIKGICFSQSDM